ncbi:hypothetical protein Nepgr_017080 [Nepenthes gracilis]|uniref:Uncharacterized protein n=1 Tax=Nepenthes gracilis TaxID=150966 RepID=A0AAD3XSS0_NEPGR|nr:hypothetical protein Nepgr_017080 [Nepenthes gracilis]
MEKPSLIFALLVVLLVIESGVPILRLPAADARPELDVAGISASGQFIGKRGGGQSSVDGIVYDIPCGTNEECEKKCPPETKVRICNEGTCYCQ